RLRRRFSWPSPRMRDTLAQSDRRQGETRAGRLDGRPRLLPRSPRAEAQIMLAAVLLSLELDYLVTWQAFAAGTTVASLVFVMLRGHAAWRRRRLSVASTEENLPWQDLLELLRQRERELAASSASPEHDLLSEDLLALLLASLPPKSARRSLQMPA